MAKVTGHQTSLESIYGKKGVPTDTPNFFAQLEAAERPADDIPWTDPQKESNVIQLPPPKLTHRVTFIDDSRVAFPELYLNVFVRGPKWEVKQFRTMFGRAQCWHADSLDKADLVVFTGGQDVSPALYGEEAHRSTRNDHLRDEQDIILYEECLAKGIPMFGVCRGMQFLHVMKGGKLFQDADGHYGKHGMYDAKNNLYLQEISSSHHQVCRANHAGGMEVLATSRGYSKKRWLNNTAFEEGQNADIEALFYRDGCILGVQGHPEYANYNKYTAWCLQQINDYIVTNPDLAWYDKTLRIKEELRPGYEEPPVITVPKSTRKKKETATCAA